MNSIAKLTLLLLLPTLALAEPKAWQQMNGANRWNLLNGLSQVRPMNWGAGGRGINYGGEVPCLEGENKNTEPRRPMPHDVAAPSTGYCLGVSIHRNWAFRELLEGRAVAPAPKAKIEKIHEMEGAADYRRVQDWMKSNGVFNYDKALEAHAVGMKEALAYAQKFPGAWVGLKSAAIHHAVQVFEVNGDLILIDPNVPEPMIGKFLPTGGFTWFTAGGKLSAFVDFLYLPVP